jgi:transcriptional regulator with XRE-family HTH domain
MGDMGYGGKVAEQQRARELRAQAWTLDAIARELGVSKSSVSLWVRDVEFTPKPRNASPHRRPSSLMVRRLAEIDRCDAEGREYVGELDSRELLLVGAALYWGEGFKRDGSIGLANTDPAVLVLFVNWLRSCFEIDERRLRVRLYLHEDLDLQAAERYWSSLLDIPIEQFQAPYRAAADPTRRTAKHRYGCPAVRYHDSHLHRRVMGLVRALSSFSVLPG